VFIGNDTPHFVIAPEGIINMIGTKIHAATVITPSVL
jgi:hypothetical protein